MSKSRTALLARVLAVYIFLVVLAQRCTGQAPFLWPDFEQLQHEAAVTLTPTAPVLAIAWIESRTDTNPHLRAHYCWNAQRHSPDCEVGRFQIKPSTAKVDCPGLDIFTTFGNHACFFTRFDETLIRGHSVREAIRRHHGGTPAGNATYLAKIEHIVTELGLNEILPLSPACRREIHS